MLNCRACLWQCIRALNHDALPASSHIASRGASFSNRFGQRHRYQTSAPVAFPREKSHATSSEDGPSTGAMRRKPRDISTHTAGLKKRARKGLTRPSRSLNETQEERKLGRRDPSISSSDWNNRKKELQYLADPLELAQFVKSELKKGRSKEMLQLVRMASNSMECIVGWNHIIDHQLKEGHVAQAVKIYNDVSAHLSICVVWERCLTLATDEKPGSVSRLLHLHYTATRPCRKCTRHRHGSPGVVDISLLICTQLSG